MSRRKQTKPAKRDACDSPPSLLPSDPELPVYVKELDGETLLLAKETLRAGTVLGTYRGTPHPAETEEHRILKVDRSDGGSPMHVMLEDGGHWMKLMRTATLPTDANICLRISGRDIVCTVTKDVNKEVELRVTYRLVDPSSHEPRTPPASPLTQVDSTETLELTEANGRDEIETESREAMPECVASALCDSSADSRSSSRLKEEEESEAVKSVRSGSEEMERQRAEESRERSPLRESRKLTSTVKEENSEKYPNETRDDRANLSSPGSAEDQSPQFHELHKRLLSDSSKTSSNPSNPKAFCEACNIQFLSVHTYQVHKKVYCKSRHDKDDSAIPIPVLESGPGGLANAFKPPSDTVILKSGFNGSVVHPSIIQPQAIYAAISTNPLILVPCSLVPGQGLVPQSAVLPSGIPGLVISGIGPTGLPAAEKVGVSSKLESAPPPRKTSHPAMSSGDKQKDSSLLSSSRIATLKRKMSEGTEVLNLKKNCIKRESGSKEASSKTPMPEDTRESEDSSNLDSPLDLTIRVKKESDSSARKSPVERRSSVISACHQTSPLHLPVYGSVSPPVTSAVPTICSVPSPTQSYSQESLKSVAVPRLPTVAPDRISPLPPVLHSAVIDKTLPNPGLPPPKLLKQGSNVCEECHIVFIKYDNLVTHKKHYCAYRRRQLSAMAAAAAAAASTSSLEHSSDDNNSNHSETAESLPAYVAKETEIAIGRKTDYGVEHCRSSVSKPVQPAFLCDACGVRFSTSDTLNAHQTYYCMKKPDSAMAKASSKLGEDGDSSNIESPFDGPEEWKCNYCDATCASYKTIRRHLLTHREPRGFKCILCGYKGNTLRGMRSHACEHLSDDSMSVEDFMTSTIVVLTDSALPLVPRSFDCSDDDSDFQREAGSLKYRERTTSGNSDVGRERVSRVVSDVSESDDPPDSPKHSDGNPRRADSFKRAKLIKTESSGNSGEVNSSAEIVNPVAMCDVVIKTENFSGEDSSQSDSKTELDHRNTKRLPTSLPSSVIRIAEKSADSSHSAKRKNRTNPELKSCKSCGVSFQHLSSLLTHKKYYCLSKSLQNCLPEAATVQ